MGTGSVPFAAMLALALTAAGAAMAYQSVARQRDYRALLARGDAALREDQMFSAIEAYSGAIALRPDSMLAHLRLGETYQRRGDIEEAAREFRRAAGLDPAATRPLEELGDAEYQRQRYGLAIEAYQRSVQRDDRSFAFSSIQVALAHAGRPDRRRTRVAWSGRPPRRPDGRRLLPAGHLSSEKRQMPAAVKALETAVSLSPA
jgi:tetratricopeptide (TPR) repeat protein